MRYLNLERLNDPVMVIVPHQDDEALLYAGIMYQAKRMKKEVKVVIVTNGDCGCSDHTKGQERLLETVKGMEKLGIPGDDILFLGYADTGMSREESFLWRLYQEKDPKKVYPSGCSDRTYALPGKPEYHVEKYGEHALYTRQMLKEDLESVLMQYRPACIFTTCYEDTHGDHAGLYLFLQEILREYETEEKGRPAVYCGLVHSTAGDECWPERTGERFHCPAGFGCGGGLRWEERYCFALPEEMSVKKGKENLKYQALVQYETALEPNAYEFLMSFIKDEEIFWAMTDHDSAGE